MKRTTVRICTHTSIHNICTHQSVITKKENQKRTYIKPSWRNGCGVSIVFVVLSQSALFFMALCRTVNKFTPLLSPRFLCHGRLSLKCAYTYYIYACTLLYKPQPDSKPSSERGEVENMMPSSDNVLSYDSRRHFFLLSKCVLPPFQNIRCFSLPCMYVDIF
jgi:hypothetical protein